MNIHFKSVLCGHVFREQFNLLYVSRALSSKNEINQSKLTVPKKYDVNAVTKEDMQWRMTTQNDENTQYFKTLRIFYTDVNNVEVAKALQTPLDLSFASIKRWFLRKDKERKISMQTYNQERNNILGNELAAAHFIVYRRGAIKFHQDDQWIKADEYQNYNLPEHYVRDKYIEAIDCSGMEIYYEGLQNFRDVKFLKWLSLNDCPTIDDWCLDTICGAHYKTLVYLDLRNCPNITERGLIALWKMEKLRILYLDDILRSSQYELTVLLLQEHLPNLQIRVGDFAEDED